MPPQENNPAPIPVGMQRPSRSAPHGLTTGKLGTPPELRARPGRRAGVEEGGGWGVLAPASAGLCPLRHVRTPKKPGCSAIPCTGGAPAAGDKESGAFCRRWGSARHGDTLGVSTLHPQPGGSAPSPSPTSRGTTAAPGPVLTQFSPAGSAQPPRLLGLLLRLTAARALRQPPAPPRYVTTSRLPRRGGRRGTRSISDSSDEQGGGHA